MEQATHHVTREEPLQVAMVSFIICRMVRWERVNSRRPQPQSPARGEKSPDPKTEDNGGRQNQQRRRHQENLV